MDFITVEKILHFSCFALFRIITCHYILKNRPVLVFRLCVIYVDLYQSVIWSRRYDRWRFSRRGSGRSDGNQTGSCELSFFFRRKLNRTAEFWPCENNIIYCLFGNKDGHGFRTTICRRKNVKTHSSQRVLFAYRTFDSFDSISDLRKKKTENVTRSVCHGMTFYLLLLLVRYIMRWTRRDVYCVYPKVLYVLCRKKITVNVFERHSKKIIVSARKTRTNN